MKLKRLPLKLDVLRPNKAHQTKNPIKLRPYGISKFI